jgi:Protein of unknown function (DUF2384)
MTEATLNTGVPSKIKIAIFGPTEDIEDATSDRDIRSNFSSFDKFRDYLAKGRGERAGVFISHDLAMAREEIEELTKLRDTPSVLVGQGQSREAKVLAAALNQRNVYFLPQRPSLEQIRRAVALMYAWLNEDPANRKEASEDAPNILSNLPSTRFLFDPKNGRLDARRVAQLFGLPLRSLSRMLGIKYETVHKTSSSAAVHEALLDYERVARALSLLNDDKVAFKQWLNRKNRDLDQRTPLEAIKEGYVTSVADLIESALLGEPR